LRESHITIRCCGRGARAVQLCAARCAPYIAHNWPKYAMPLTEALYLIPMNESVEEEIESYWCVIANLMRDCPSGEAVSGVSSGTRLFRGGAKVHVIGMYRGAGRNIVVVAQHRKSRSFLKCVINACYVENMRIKLIYSPKVLEIRRAAVDHGVFYTETKEDAEEIIDSITRIKNYEKKRKASNKNKI